MRNTIRKFLAGEIEPIEAPVENISNVSQVEEKKSSDTFIPSGPNFFELKLTNHEIFYFMDFLDPVTLMNASRTCKRFYEVAKNHLLYRKFCLAYYRSKPRLPEPSPFLPMVSQIANSTFGEFTTAVINQAKTDMRSLVWVPDLKHFQTPGNYFKQHKSYRDLFLLGPRVRYSGVYIMKENYIRIGMRMNNQQYDPQHLVEFFRYLRFFPDGLVISCLSVKKLTNEKIIKFFRFVQSETEQIDFYAKNSNIKSILFGEYIVRRKSLFIKLAAKTTIYEFEMEIGSSQPGMFDELKPISQTMRIAGMNEGANIQQDQQFDKALKFISVPGLTNDLPSFSSGLYI